MDYLLTFIGLCGFWAAGARLWWCWYVNIANQILWTAYALTTGQYGFLFGAAFYTIVFARNAFLWTREHYAPAPSRPATVALGHPMRVMLGGPSMNPSQATNWLPPDAFTRALAEVLGEDDPDHPDRHEEF